MIKKYLINLMITALSLNSAIVMAKQPTPILQTIRVSDTNYNLELGMAELAPNAAKGFHMHSGPEVGYVLDGEIILLVKGQSAKTIKAGESFQTPAYVVHDTKAGPKGAKILASWVSERGKAFALPAALQSNVQ